MVIDAPAKSAKKCSGKIDNLIMIQGSCLLAQAYSRQNNHSLMHKGSHCQSSFYREAGPIISKSGYYPTGRARTIETGRLFQRASFAIKPAECLIDQ